LKQGAEEESLGFASDYGAIKGLSAVGALRD